MTNTTSKPYRIISITVITALLVIAFSSCNNPVLDTEERQTLLSNSQQSDENALITTKSAIDSAPSPESTSEMSEIGLDPEQLGQETTFLRGISIGNALEAPSTEDWGVTIREEYFKTIQAAGFNAVRIPVRFSDYTGPAPAYVVQEAFFKIVDEVIQWDLDSGLTVVLDLHHFDAFMQNPSNEQDRFLSIWEQIAIRYQNIPSKLYFELLNEPYANVTYTIWNDLVEKSIALIRDTNPSRKLIVGGVNFSDIESLIFLELPADDNLIATFHFYEPFEFTHQGAEWVSGSSAWIGTKWENTPAEEMEIRQALDSALEWSILYEIPLVMGEFGVTSKADSDSRHDWIQFVTLEAESRGISWIFWVFCSDFGIYDCQTETWDESILNVLINQ